MQARSKLFVIGAALSILTSCNTGGFNNPLGTRCGDGADPISMTPTGAQKKVAMKPNDPSGGEALTPGRYSYARSDIFYKEQNSQEPIYLQVTDTSPNGDGSVRATVSCLRNAKPHMDEIQGTTHGITDMVICPADSRSPGKKVITTHKFHFEIMKGVIAYSVIDAKNPDQKLNGDPDDAYPANPGDGSDKFNVDPILLKNPGNFEVHSAMTGATGIYKLSIVLNYAQCNSTNCADCY